MADNDTVLAAAAQLEGRADGARHRRLHLGFRPAPRGSHMIVHADGRFEGSVSGGCVESDILATAAEVIAGAPFQVKNYGVADAAAWEVGLPCGGEISVMVQPVSAAGFDPELFDRIAEARDAGKALTVTDRSRHRPIELAPAGGRGVRQPLRSAAPLADRRRGADRAGAGRARARRSASRRTVDRPARALPDRGALSRRRRSTIAGPTRRSRPSRPARRPRSSRSATTPRSTIPR